MFSRGLKSSAIDRQLLIYLGLVIILGLAALISASSPIGYAKFQDAYYYVKKQILLGFLPGLVLLILLARINYAEIQKWSRLIYISALVLLVLVLIPGFGIVINGSRSWLLIKGYSLQPSEFAKLAVIIFLAALLAERKISWDKWQETILMMLAYIAPAVLLVLAQPDLGTVIILAGIIFAMFFLGGAPARYLLVLACLGLAAFSVLVIKVPYRLERLTTFLYPEVDSKGVGYHINQAFLAVGSGGFWGLGFGHSRQKFQYLPEVDADSIYAIIAEENGFLISSGLVILFLLLGWRCFKIARAAPNEFGRLLVAGAAIWFLWQSFLNIGAMVGIMPLTGVPLPLISHGGSAFVSIMAAFGIVANVSRSSIVKKISNL